MEGTQVLRELDSSFCEGNMGEFVMGMIYRFLGFFMNLLQCTGTNRMSVFLFFSKNDFLLKSGGFERCRSSKTSYWVLAEIKILNEKILDPIIGNIRDKKSDISIEEKLTELNSSEKASDSCDSVSFGSNKRLKRATKKKRRNEIRVEITEKSRTSRK